MCSPGEGNVCQVSALWNQSFPPLCTLLLGRESQLWSGSYTPLDRVGLEFLCMGDLFFSPIHSIIYLYHYRLKDVQHYFAAQIVPMLATEKSLSWLLCPFNILPQLCVCVCFLIRCRLCILGPNSIRKWCWILQRITSQSSQSPSSPYWWCGFDHPVKVLSHFSTIQLLFPCNSKVICRQSL